MSERKGLETGLAAVSDSSKHQVPKLIVGTAPPSPTRPTLTRHHNRTARKLDHSPRKFALHHLHHIAADTHHREVGGGAGEFERDRARAKLVRDKLSPYLKRED